MGQPTFTTGVWNNENYTTTLALDASSIAEINWNDYKLTTYTDAHSGISPSNITVGYSGNQTLNFNVSQGYRFNVLVDGVQHGQISSYAFENITASHVVSVTSTSILPFPLETLIAAAVIVIIVVVLALVFKKGYITIESGEENSRKSSEDYTI
jgi:hypothetical protein